MWSLGIPLNAAAVKGGLETASKNINNYELIIMMAHFLNVVYLYKRKAHIYNNK